MTTQELQEKAKLIKPLIDALVKGKTVQVKYYGAWNDIPHNDVLSSNLEVLNCETYRIKPQEPRELFYCLNCNKTFHSNTHKDSALYYNHKLIHYKEVIE